MNFNGAYGTQANGAPWTKYVAGYSKILGKGDHVTKFEGHEKKLKHRAIKTIQPTLDGPPANPLDRSVEGMYFRLCLEHKLPVDDDLKCPHGHKVKTWGVVKTKAAW